MDIPVDSRNDKALAVIYSCPFPVSTSFSDDRIYFNYLSPCEYGYKAEAGETAPKITVPKKFAPDAPLYNDKALQIDKVELAYGKGEVHQLKTKFKKPPFGSIRSCHTAKVDLKFGDTDGSIKTSRLTFSKHNADNGKGSWIAQNPGSWPTIESIVAYYDESPSSEEAHLYLICDWLPSAEELESNQVVA